MENNKINKKSLIISIIVFIVGFSIYGLYLFSNKIVDNQKIDVTEKYLIDKRYNDLLVTDIEAFKLNKYIHLSFKIENTGETNFGEKNIKIVFLDKSGNVIEKKDLYIPEVKEKASTRVDMLITKELSEADDFILSDE